MKALCIAGLLATTWMSAYAEDDDSTVRFSNNDRLTGSMESLTLEQLVLSSPSLEKPAPFFLKDVLDLTLSAHEPEAAGRHEAVVSLTNGDKARGQLASVTQDFIELETWFAGRMKFNRLMISDIRISERPDLLFRGPTGLDGWKFSNSKPAWTYQSSSFRSTGPGSIARDVNLPDECSIAFNAEWRNGLNLKLAFFSDDLESAQPDTGYEMVFQKRFLYLRSCKTSMALGNSSKALALAENEKARIEIRASIKSGKFCILVDGVLIDVWTDPDFAGIKMGKGIHFITQNDYPVQISRIEISKWDGHVDEVATQDIEQGMDEDAPVAEPTKPAPGRMLLRNGDSISGEVLSIADGFIQVKTPFREIKLPLESLRSVALSTVDLERCKREQGDVRAWFPDGTSLVFRLTDVGEGTLSGTSQNFGAAIFKMDAFNRIEFNIYDPELEDVRMANGW